MSFRDYFFFTDKIIRSRIRHHLPDLFLLCSKLVRDVLEKNKDDEEFYIDDQPFGDSAIIPEQLVPFPYENTERGAPQFDAAINALLGII